MLILIRRTKEDGDAEPKPLVIGKQTTMFDLDERLKSDYTLKVPAPTYEPKGRKPHLFQLLDGSRARKLAEEVISQSGISDEEKAFLLEAAKRHNVFNYKLIAEYYAHASPEMQELMERSALVIIDFDDAIKLGYVKYTEEIAKIYTYEHGTTN